MKVIKYITSFLAKGTKVYYVTGNHDEMLRKFKGFQLGSFEIVNKIVLELNGQKAWFFHGDVFDVSMKHSKWLAKLGGIGYDFLILINTIVNWGLENLGYGRISFSKRIKNSVKGAISHINNFEETVADLAIYNHYDFVICGHIHQPIIRKITDKDNKQVTYLNSGDWIENMTALEYHNQQWSIYEYANDPLMQNISPNGNDLESEFPEARYKNKQLFDDLIQELNVIR